MMNSFSHHPQSKNSAPRFQNFSADQFSSELHLFKKPRFSVTMRTHNPGSKLAIPFKSQSCLLYQKGRCYYGEQCHYAHDISEIRNPSYSGLDTVPYGCHSDNGNCNVSKTTKCRWFLNGELCPYDDKCQFLHKCDIVECKSSNVGEYYERRIFQKTKLCNKWEKFGNCRYGVKCIFAHGNAELKKISSLAVPIYGYASSKLTLPASQSKDAAAASDIAIETANKMQLKGKRRFMKWNIDKISRVYADWIDCNEQSPCAFEQSWELKMKNVHTFC